MTQKQDDHDHRGHKHERQVYIVTFDLGQKMQCLHQIGWKTPKPDDPIFAEIYQEIITKFRGYFPQVDVIGVTMHDLADEIVSRAVSQKTLLQNGHVVSTCLEIADARRGFPLEINRIIDQHGKILGLGPRPGYPPLSEQISGIAAMVNGAPIVLVEDGSFTGNTIVHILKEFKEHNLTIAAVVIGFAFHAALKNIHRHFDGEIIVVEEVRDYIDWMPDHDFFPFAPNCGRVLGLRWGDQHYPLYTHNTATYSVPYLFTSCPMGKWTSIPQPHQQHEFSMFCAMAGAKLFHHIESMNGKPLTTGDLLSVRPRISIPMSVNQAAFPHLDTYVSDYYSDTCQSLS